MGSVEHTQDMTEVFELSGGELCLDFANTWGNHADPASDRLVDYGWLIAFAVQARAIDRRNAEAIARAADKTPDAAAAAFSVAREVRGALYRIFSAGVAGRDVPSQDVTRINTVLGEALSRRQLKCCDDGFEWCWDGTDTNDLRMPLWPIVASAATLLTSDTLARVRECDADDCNWLFIDQSRSRSRRWCSMQSCGNRAKARRHYHRQR